MTAPLIAIVGRAEDVHNYENALRKLQIPFSTTQNPEEAALAGTGYPADSGVITFYGTKKARSGHL